MASYLIYIVLLTFLYLLFKEKNWRRRAYLFFLAALSTLLSRGIVTETIRFFYHRPRPFVALGIHALVPDNPIDSFPSGHAAFVFALAMAIYYSFKLYETKESREANKKWNTWFWASAIVIGLARIFVGIHWPSDIVGGAVIGILSAYVVYKILPEPTSEIRKK